MLPFDINPIRLILLYKMFFAKIFNFVCTKCF